MFPDLFSHNPASHLVWWVAAGLFGTLALFALVELFDWLRGLLHPGRADQEGHDEWAMREPENPVRRRFYHRLAPFLGNIRDHRPNVPPSGR